MNRIISAIAVAAALIAPQTHGQDATVTEPVVTTNSAMPTVEEPEDKAWSFSVSGYMYFVPDDDDYFQPTVTFDHKWLHLEARYNYEDMETASFWAGYNFGGGEKLAWEFTPMLGGVFGNTAGVAPGYKGSLSWWKLELYSEGEYVFDSRDSSDSFWYNWSELSLAPVEWFRFGVVVQRTRAYEADRDTQGGLLFGFSYKKLDVTTYIFSPDQSDPTVVLGATFSF
jgi:hypothetical protein